MANKTYGTVSPERQKAMSGLEFVKGLVSGALPLNTIAQTLDYDAGQCRRYRQQRCFATACTSMAVFLAKTFASAH
jgi:hypothetical protein